MNFIPTDIQLLITSYIPDFNTLRSLSQTCKNLHQRVLFDQYRKQHLSEFTDLSYRISNLPSYRFLELLLDKGCQRCGKPRIRKIIPEFAIRVCQDCRDEISISEYRLREDYGIDSSVLVSLPFVTAKLWNSFYGDYVIKIYWKKDIQSILGTSIDTYKTNMIKDALVLLQQTYPDMDKSMLNKVTVHNYNSASFLRHFHNEIWLKRCIEYVTKHYPRVDVDNKTVAKIIQTAISKEDVSLLDQFASTELNEKIAYEKNLDVIKRLCKTYQVDWKQYKTKVLKDVDIIQTELITVRRCRDYYNAAFGDFCFLNVYELIIPPFKDFKITEFEYFKREVDNIVYHIMNTLKDTFHPFHLAEKQQSRIDNCVTLKQLIGCMKSMKQITKECVPCGRIFQMSGFIQHYQSRHI